MNNKFKGLYDTEGTSFISDKVEPINYYEPTIKTAKIQNRTYSINFDKTELYKEIEKLQQELQRKDDEINDLKSSIADYQEAVDDYQDELKRKDNIINELKEYLKLEIAEWQDVDNIPTRARVEEDKDILDKIEELENDK